MDIDEKTLRILNAMQGITYKEWMKISNIVDMHFKNRANQQLNEIVIASPVEVMKSAKLLWHYLNKHRIYSIVFVLVLDMYIVICKTISISWIIAVIQVLLKVFHRFLVVSNCSCVCNVYPFAKQTRINTHIFTFFLFRLMRLTSEKIIRRKNRILQ